MLKNGRKPSSKGQAVKHSVTVKAKIKVPTEADMEFAVNEPAAKPILKKKKKRAVSAEQTVVDTLKERLVKRQSRDLVVQDDPVMELTVPEKAPKKRISKLRTKGMRSIIGDDAENIHQLLEVGDADSATSLIYKTALQTLVDLLPYAEHQVRITKGQRGVYQVNSLIQSVRELMVDLQSAQDRGAMGELMVDKIVRPAFLDIGMSVVREFAEVLATAKEFMPEDRYVVYRAELKSAKERIGHDINVAFESAKEQTRQFLQR